MLRLIRCHTENHGCIGFKCLAKKEKFPTKSFQNTSQWIQEPGAFRSDRVSDFEYSPTHSPTVTPSSGSGPKAEIFNMDKMGEILIYKDKKSPIPNLQRDLEIYNDSSSTTTSSLTWVSDGCNIKFDVVSKGTTSYQETTSYQDRDSESWELYSSRESSTLSALSGPHESILNSDFNATFPPRESKKTKSKDFGLMKLQVQNRRKTSDIVRLKRDSIRIEVVSRGTRLMRTMKFPTVIVQIKKKKLQNSMIYYIVLKSVGRYVGDILCLLFTSNNRSENMQKAELLPLCMVPSKNRSRSFKLNPMLLQERYRCLFENGCTFKVKAIESGRGVNFRERLWKNYNVKNIEIHDLLSRLLYIDISRAPSHMLKRMTPLRNTEGLSERISGRRKSYGHLSRKIRSPIVPKKKEPYVQTNFRHRGLDTGVSSNFVNYGRKGIQPQTRDMNKHFLCSFQNKEKRNLGNTCKLKNYLYMSHKI